MNKNSIYFYRGYTIINYNGGWLYGEDDHNIYKTLDDCKNAIDKYLGGFSSNKIPKRHDKSIKIIGEFKEE